MMPMPPKERDAWLECVGYSGSYPAPCRDEHVPVELEEDDDPLPGTGIAARKPSG